MTLENQIAEDYGIVLKEAKSMGCNKINALYNIPLDNMKAIVNALEEVQKYHDLEQKLNGVDLVMLATHWMEMAAEGEVKGYQRGRVLTNEDADQWDAYKAIGTPEECRVAVEKQKPHKWERGIENDVRCPFCGTMTTKTYEHKYCSFCGQRLE